MPPMPPYSPHFLAKNMDFHVFLIEKSRNLTINHENTSKVYETSIVFLTLLRPCLSELIHSGRYWTLRGHRHWLSPPEADFCLKRSFLWFLMFISTKWVPRSVKKVFSTKKSENRLKKWHISSSVISFFVNF